ncbi:MAG: hypothetical protein PVH73_05695 [Candidatus Bathyarchaeota archaeon]
MGRNARNRRNSGQTLVITALVIALLVLSIVYGVFEAGRRSEMRSAATLNSPVLATKLGLRNTVISSLVNVSNGGEAEMLAANLNKYASIVGNQSFFGKCVVLFTVSDASPYQSGMWISWGSDGTGVSSAYANFTLLFTETDSEIQLEHTINVTTMLDVEGTYSKLGGTLKQVNVTCRIFNEGESALANNTTLYYDYDGNLGTSDWTAVDSPTTTDYGNGTYTTSFTAETQTSEDPMLVSAHAYDVRDIFVLANATCTET